MKIKKIFAIVVTVALINIPATVVNAEQQSKIKELTGNNIYEISTKISKEGWKENTDTVVLINEKSSVDAIVATPLTRVYDAPMLLTSQQDIPIQTMQELKRLNPKNIIVIGGESAISPEIINNINKILPSTKINRIGGNSRYETCLNIAKEIEKKTKVEEVYVGYGKGEVDLLSIAPIAGYKNQPIILTDKDDLNTDIYNWISNEKLKNAYFIGGENSISDSIINEVSKVTSQDLSNNRIYGNDRYETNAKVIEKFYNNKIDNIAVSNGNDVISTTLGNQLCGKFNFPMFLTSNNKLSLSQVNTLDNISPSNVYLVGDEVNKDKFKEVIDRLEFNDIKNGDSVIFFIPHQDDEMLSFSTVLKRYVDKGCDVKVVLMANGSQTKAKNALNGKKVCSIHNCVHNPINEGYTFEKNSVEYVDEIVATNYRNNEFYRALCDLGIREDKIYISDFAVNDGQLNKEVAMKGITEFLNKYPNSRVHTFYDVNYSKGNHVDHMGLGEGARELFNSGTIKELYMHVEPYLYDDLVKAGLDKGVYEYLAKDDIQKASIIKGLNAYCTWDPKNGKLAIGYHSVPMDFDQAIARPVDYVMKCEGVK